VPILDVEIVKGEESQLDSTLAQKLAEAAGVALGLGSARVWIKLRAISRENYAENGVALEELPVFVSILMKQHKLIDLSTVALDLANAFGKVLNRPTEKIHILFQPECAGRIAFGGKL
jgi:phenylpyruvate tautomerase PptA (4-oxalocrotonate tautomerase family)